MWDPFYRDVLPVVGQYVLFLGKRKQHIWCADLDELTRQTEAHASTPDLYFAVSSFSTTSGRTADNALFSRAFYFDIDAGPEKFAKHGDKVYPTQGEALAAVMAWCRASSLKPRQVVSSGAGLHVYFALDRDVPIAEWKPVADGLKNMALAQGLRIDPAVTGDAARVLRAPGTLHHSGAQVLSLGRSDKTCSLAHFADLVHGFAPAPKRQRERVSRLNDDVLAAPMGPPKTLAKVEERCAAMSTAMALRGDVAEPYWRAMLGVIKHTVEGEKAAHLYSQGHPDYDEADTQAKLDRWTAGPATCAVFEAENPTACQNCKYRGTIKSPIVLGQMTPMQVAQLPPTEPEEESTPSPFSDDEEDAPVSFVEDRPWASFMPEKFRVVPKGSGYIMAYKHMVSTVNELSEKVEMEVETPFTGVPFWFESWAAGSDDQDQALAVYCVWDVHRKRVARYTFATRNAAKPDTLFGTLAAQNIQVFPTTNHSKAAMVDFVKSSLEMMRNAGQRPKITDRFGTMFDSRGRVLVAQGAHLIDHEGRIVEGVVNERLRYRGNAYRMPLPPTSKGSWEPDVWETDILPKAQRHIAYLREFYDHPNFSPYQLAIMLAWASPMLAFMQGSYRPGNNLPGIGLTVTLYSPRSGIGKTAAMHAAALAFGSPSDICLQLDRNSSTGNARQALLLQSGTMPSFMDEMEDVDARDLASLVSAVGNGTSKARMTKDLSLTGGVTMALVNVMSTNKSHREIVAADRDESPAVQFRMLEIECSGVAAVDQARGMEETRARSALHDCAGAVGAMIHRRMCAMTPEELNALGLSCADTACSMLNGRQDGRFLWRALGAMLAVRRMLKMDGLSVFSIDTLRAEFQKWHDAGYEFAQDRALPSDGGAIMAAFLSDVSGSILVTRTETHRIGGRDTVGDIPLNDRIPDPVIARAVLNLHCVYVKTSALRDWCIKKKIGSNELLVKCREAGLVEVPDPKFPKQLNHRMDLFKGTKIAQGVRDSVLKVLLDKLPGEIAGMPTSAANVVELRTPPAPGAAATERTA